MGKILSAIMLALAFLFANLFAEGVLDLLRQRLGLTTILISSFVITFVCIITGVMTWKKAKGGLFG